jgi:hypothetical protein
MRQVTIYKSAPFELVSLGNGTAYELTRHDDGASIFWQGDDATELRQNIEAYEMLCPDYPIVRLLADIWNNYSTTE